MFDNTGRRNGRDLVCIAGRWINNHYVVIVEGEWENLLCTVCRMFSDQYVVIVERELEENFCVPHVELLVNIMC
jgi:hypothetical protein